MEMELIRGLWDYHWWANRRLFDVAAALGDEATQREVGKQFSFSTLKGMFAHIYGADWVWLERWKGNSPTALPGEAELKTMADLRARWDPFETEQRRFLEAITPADLPRVVAYKDTRGNAYTSMFVESKIAKWSPSEMKLIEKLPVHYNIGHIASAHGDTVKPHGHWVVAMNKWAIDRFADVGPLLPQNFQLVDVSGPNMQLVYDLPIPLGEPHYTQIVAADRIKAIDHYAPVGFNPVTREKDANATEGGTERIERRDDGVHVHMTQVRSHFTPDIIRVKEGDTVHLHITNLEQAKDATHGFGISSYNIALSLEPGEHNDVSFEADHAGVFPFYCLEFCSALHLEMAGYLIVEPAAAKTADAPKRSGDRG